MGKFRIELPCKKGYLIINLDTKLVHRYDSRDRIIECTKLTLDQEYQVLKAMTSTLEENENNV